MVALRQALRWRSTMTNWRNSQRSRAVRSPAPASRVERAHILLAYRDEPCFFAVSQALWLHHQTVQRCVKKAVALGPLGRWTIAPDPVGSAGYDGVFSDVSIFRT